MVPPRAARRRRAPRLAAAAGRRGASLAARAGGGVARLGGAALPCLPCVHRVDVAAQRALRADLRASRTGALAARAWPAGSAAAVAGRGDGLLRGRVRPGEHPRFRARGRALRRRPGARAAGAASDRNDLRAQLAVREVQLVPPFPGLLPGADGRDRLVLLRRAAAVSASLPSRERAAPASARVGVAREYVSQRPGRLLLRLRSRGRPDRSVRPPAAGAALAPAGARRPLGAVREGGVADDDDRDRGVR